MVALLSDWAPSVHIVGDLGPFYCMQEVTMCQSGTRFLGVACSSDEFLVAGKMELCFPHNVVHGFNAESSVSIGLNVEVQDFLENVPHFLAVSSGALVRE